MNFNKNFGAFFRTEQIIMTQVIIKINRKMDRRKMYSIMNTSMDSIFYYPQSTKKPQLSITNKQVLEISAINPSVERDVTDHRLLICGSSIWEHQLMTHKSSIPPYVLKYRNRILILRVFLALMKTKFQSLNKPSLEESPVMKIMIRFLIERYHVSIVGWRRKL